MNGYIQEIRKLQKQVDNLRAELAQSQKNQIPKGSLVADFSSLAVLKEHADPNVFQAFLFNVGCRSHGGDVWITPQGEEVRSPYGYKPAL